MGSPAQIYRPSLNNEVCIMYHEYMANLRKVRDSSLVTQKSGFTLIELLVAISIISILTALLTANFIGARQRGRDGQRKANLYQLQSALELYRADTGVYPPSAALSACGGSLASATGVVYMQKIPCDPSVANQAYAYTAIPANCDNVTTSCTSYTLFACLENTADSEIDTDPNACASADVNAPFKLTNP